MSYINKSFYYMLLSNGFLHSTKNIDKNIVCILLNSIIYIIHISIKLDR